MQSKTNTITQLLKCFIVIIGFLTFALHGNAQKIKIIGFVIDGESLKDLSGVHVYLQEHIGTATDIDGKFHFQVNYLDTLHFSRVGYDSTSIVVTEIDSHQNFFISMKRSLNILDNVDVTAVYQSQTILKRPKQQVYLVPGVKYSDKVHEEDYHMGLEALASPMTGLYRLFSKRYKEEKKFYKIQKVNKIEDELFEKASKNLTGVLTLMDEYLDADFYRDFIHFSGLTTRFVAESSEYELLLILPQAIEQYYKHLDEKE